MEVILREATKVEMKEFGHKKWIIEVGPHRICHASFETKSAARREAERVKKAFDVIEDIKKYASRTISALTKEEQEYISSLVDGQIVIEV